MEGGEANHTGHAKVQLLLFLLIGSSIELTPLPLFKGGKGKVAGSGKGWYHAEPSITMGEKLLRISRGWHLLHCNSRAKEPPS